MSEPRKLPDVPVTHTNPHFRTSESTAAHARRRGWGPGTQLVADEGHGPLLLTITAVGKEAVLARSDTDARERSWSLSHRDWVEIGPLPDTSWDAFDMEAIARLAAAHGLTAEQVMRGAAALYQYEESLRGVSGQVVHAMAARHVQAALRVLGSLGLPHLEVEDHA